MRSKEVDKAIEDIKRIDVRCFINGMYEVSTYIVERAEKVNNNIDIVLNYISDLEEELDSARRKNESFKNQLDECIHEDVIRDKIKELDDYYKKEVYPIKYQWADIDITEFFDSQIELLNELLEN